jgi:hypothetical protein
MNASDIVADRLITRGIYLERYKAGFNNRILAELEKLEGDLTRELVDLFGRGISAQSTRVKRLEGLLGQARSVIRRSYSETKKLSGKQLLGLAANEQKYVVDAINETAGVEIADIILNYDQLKKLTDDTLIHGAKSADWWERQGGDLEKRFSDQMRQGVLRGENLDQLTGRVRGTQARAFTDGVMQASRRQADALVRTSVQAVANATRQESYSANAEIVSAIQWVSTLDSRTCWSPETLISMADGSKKPIGEIRAGDVVRGGLSGRPCRVLGTVRTSQNTSISIYSEYGYVGRATDSHLLLTRSGWSPAKDFCLPAHVPEREVLCRSHEGVSQAPEGALRELGAEAKLRIIQCHPEARHSEGGCDCGSVDILRGLRDRETKDCRAEDAGAERVQYDNGRGGRRGLPSGGACSCGCETEGALQERPSAEGEASAVRDRCWSKSVCREQEVLLNGCRKASDVQALGVGLEGEYHRIEQETEVRGVTRQGEQHPETPLGGSCISGKGKCRSGKSPSGTSGQRSGVEDQKSEENGGGHEIQVGGPCLSRKDEASGEGTNSDWAQDRHVPGSGRSEKAKAAGSSVTSMVEPGEPGCDIVVDQAEQVGESFIRGEKRIGRVEIVSLTIEGDESYVAGGLIVHNTPICMALSGKLWTTKEKKPLGHSLDYPGTTAHWNCRSTQIPVLKKWEDLIAKKDQAEIDEEFRRQLREQGFSDDEIANIKRNTRASMDGQVAKDITFDDWLKGKSPDFQDKMLGRGKGKLFRDGKISLTDLVDQRLRPLTLDELSVLPQPRPGPQPIKLPSRRKRAPKPSAPPPRPENEFPPADEVEVVRTLGGSTGAELVKDKSNGKLYVRKKGNSPDHLREEFAADQAYRAAGADVPRAILHETPAGPVKLAEFIEGRSLADFLAKASPQEVTETLGRLRKGFATDAVLANHDVVGLSLDNVLVDIKGVPWRIDNGGSLRFRAQGAPKSTAVWNAMVGEIDSLRDATINPQTARVFAELTELEIEEQIRDLLTRESAIIDAVPDSAKIVLRDRFQTLRNRLDQLVTEATAKRIREAKMQGVSLPSDKDEFEDVQFLIWEELDTAGQPLTAAKLKLTARGAEKVMEAIKSSIPAKAKAAPTAKVLPEDVFWSRIEQALKTINVHAGDGQYNSTKLDALKVVKIELSGLNAPTKALQDMKGYYEAVIQSAEQALATKTKTPLFEQFRVQPPAATPKVAKVAPKFAVTDQALTWPVKSYKGGVAQRTDSKITIHGSLLEQDGYVVDLAGVKVRFIPYRPGDAHGTLSAGNAQALMGQVEVEIAGPATRQNINRAIEALKQLGLSPTKASPDYLEAVWLRKTLSMRTDVVSNALRSEMTDIMELEGIADVDRVARLREIAKKTLGIDPPRDAKMWMPQTDGRGQGWGFTERWDLPASKIESEMKTYALSHSTSGSISDLVSKLLEQGGELTSTTERVRKGIDIRMGMSPGADMVKGGATHVYTRIKAKTSAYRETGLVFKRRALARQDAFAFEADWYGGQHDFFATDQIYKSRGKTIADLKRFAQRSDNETLFKWSLSILDDIEAIIVSTEREKKAVLKLFSDRGISQLQDGTKISDVVRTVQDPMP